MKPASYGRQASFHLNDFNNRLVECPLWCFQNYDLGGLPDKAYPHWTKLNLQPKSSSELDGRARLVALALISGCLHAVASRENKLTGLLRTL